LLAVGLGGILDRVRQRRHGEANPDSREFLIAAEQSLLGVSEWIGRYAEFLAGEARRHADPSRAAELSRMSAIAARVAFSPPQTFREALQLIWFVHQAIHIEGHGYSNTPDRLDQILYPLYLRDKEAGRLSDDEALTLCENFILKMRDNTFWSVEHSLTQGVCLGGCSPEGRDQTNELSWLLLRAADNMSLPDPLVWIRWHPDMDQGFFDFCLETLAGPTCFPLMMSDTAVPAMFMELGVSREDAFEYVPVGCNELAIPGKAYFNPCAYVNYLAALEQAMTQGRGYAGDKPVDPNLPPPEHLGTFDDLVGAIGRVMRRQLEWSYADAMIELSMQMRWGQTPFTSCFFDGCIERAQDMTQRTRYNILASGGIAFANMTDCLAAIREVVYEKREATPQDVARACAANFQNHESLRAKLLSAPKHGNDDPGMRAIVKLVERLRVEPEKDICCDPRDGTPFATGHVVRSAAVIQGALTGATPDGRLAGTPLASSVAASVGVERSGPTAVLNSVLELDPVHCWRGGYNVNLRFQRKMLADARNREKVRAMLNSFFARGGQEMQINCVDTATLRAAQAKPDEYPDLVVRVAGFSEFFTKLDPRIQEDLVSRTEHE
jgi:formate C-acetyltransferase